ANAPAKMYAPHPETRAANVPRARDSSAPARSVTNTAVNRINSNALRSAANTSRTCAFESKDQAGQARVRRNSPPAGSARVLLFTQLTYHGPPNTNTKMNATSVAAPVAVRYREV